MLRDFVGQSVTAPGTSTTVVLGAALAGFRAFSAAGAFTNGASLFYYLSDNSQAEWGIATLATGTPDNLTSRTPIGNTAGTTARLNFASTTYCYNSLPSARAIYVDSTNTAAVVGSLTVSVNANVAGALAVVGNIILGNASSYQIADGGGTPRTILSANGGFTRFAEAGGYGFIQFTDRAISVEWGRIVGGLGWTGQNNVPIVSGYDTGAVGQELLRIDSNNVSTMRIPGTGTGWRVVDHAFSRELLKVTDSGAATLNPSNVNGLTITETNTTTNTTLAVLNLSRATSNFELFQVNGSAVGSITTNGSTTSYNTTSDYRLKILHGPSDGAFIDRVPVYDGAWKAEPNVRHPMLVAHELAQYAPWAVHGIKDAVDAKTGEIMPQLVGYSSLVPPLIARLQARGRQIETLEARMTNMTSVVAELALEVAMLRARMGDE